MTRPVSKGKLSELRILESRLKSNVQRGAVNDAEQTVKEICRIFKDDPNHARVLEAKLWYFECLFDANHIATAESGFVSIRRNANANTRSKLEATLFQGLCLLRRKKVSEAKQLIRLVFRRLGSIRSKKTRFLLERRIIERLEDESILTELIGINEGPLNPDKIHADAVVLLQTKSEQEILELMASALPPRAIFLLQDMRSDAILQLPQSDWKQLPAANAATMPLSLGKRIAALVKRIGWRTVCDEESPLYQLWSSKAPEVFSAGFFAKALCESFQHWEIQIPAIVTGVTAIVMKYSAHEFCAWAKPTSIMETRRKS